MQGFYPPSGCCLKGVEPPAFEVIFRLCAENEVGDVHLPRRRKKRAHKADSGFDYRQSIGRGQSFIEEQRLRSEWLDERKTIPDS